MSEKNMITVDLDDKGTLRKLLCDCLGIEAINYYLNGDFTRNQLIGEDFDIYSSSQYKSYCVLLNLWRWVNKIANSSPYQNDLKGRLELLVANMVNPAVGAYPSENHSLFYGAHLGNGGEPLEAPEANDDCGRLLFELAAEYYWILLIDPQKEVNAFSLDDLLHETWSINLPQLIPLWEALIQRQGIQKYFPYSELSREVDNPQRLCSIHTVYIANPSTSSAGKGTAMQLIGGMVISALRAAIFFEESPKVGNLYTCLMASLAAVEYALTATPRETLWIAGMHGVILPDDDTVISGAKVWIKKGNGGSQPSATCQSRESGTGETRGVGDIQLATLLPYQLFDLQSVLDEKGEDFSLLDVKEFENAYADLRKQRDRCVQHVTLGLLLSDDSDHSLWFRWGTSLNPSGMGGSTELNPERDATLYKNISELTVNQVDAWRRWIDILENAECEKIDLAMRKVVSASNNRINPEDILLDSVTAWENLVGDRGETTFKVTTALGLLLGDKDESPRAIQDRCKKIYNTRSQLIHGSNQKMQVGQLYQDSEDALEFAKRALRKMLCERKDLLTLKEGGERARALILGEIAGGDN